MTKIIFKPKCCCSGQQLAITNRGHLIPCCYIDNTIGMSDPIIQQLLTVSKISDYEKIEEIMKTQEWIQFEENLLSKNGAWPLVCVHHCQVRADSDIVRKEEIFDPATMKRIEVRRF